MSNAFYDINGSFASVDNNIPIYDAAVISEIRINKSAPIQQNRTVFALNPNEPFLKNQYTSLNNSGYNSSWKDPQFINNSSGGSLDIYGYEYSNGNRNLNIYDNVHIAGIANVAKNMYGTNLNLSGNLLTQKDAVFMGNVVAQNNLISLGTIVSTENIIGENVMASNYVAANNIYGNNIVGESLLTNSNMSNHILTNNLSFSKDNEIPSSKGVYKTIPAETSNVFDKYKSFNSSIINDDDYKNLVIIGNKSSDNDNSRNVSVIDNLNISKKLCIGKSCIDETSLYNLLNPKPVKYNIVETSNNYVSASTQRIPSKENNPSVPMSEANIENKITPYNQQEQLHAEINNTTQNYVYPSEEKTHYLSKNIQQPVQETHVYNTPVSLTNEVNSSSNINLSSNYNPNIASLTESNQEITKYSKLITLPLIQPESKKLVGVSSMNTPSMNTPSMNSNPQSINWNSIFGWFTF